MTDMSSSTTRVIFPYEADCCDFVSQEKSLRTVMAKIQKTRAIKTVFSAWPNLEEAARRLARHITHLYPAEGQFDDVLSNSLAKALEAYELASQKAKKESELGDAFVRALVHEAASIINFDVYGLWEDQRSERWEFMTWPLLDWSKKRGFERIVFTPKSVLVTPKERVGVRILVAGQILTVKDAAVIFGDVHGVINELA